MYYLNLLVILFVFVFLIFGCRKSAAQFISDANQARCEDPSFDHKVKGMLKFSVPTIDVDSLNNIQGEVYIFDAREKEEYLVSHIPGAKYIGYKDFDLNLIKDVPKSAKIVVYCSIGYRSEKISERLRKQGYDNVSNLFGSIFEWVNRGYQIVDSTGVFTTKVHTYNKQWGKWMTNANFEKTW